MRQRECFGLEIDIGITEINEMIMNLNLELFACSCESCHSMYLEEDRGQNTFLSYNLERSVVLSRQWIIPVGKNRQE